MKTKITAEHYGILSQKRMNKQYKREQMTNNDKILHRALNGELFNELLPATIIAQILGCSRYDVYHRANAAGIQRHKVKGKATRFRLSDFYLLEAGRKPINC